nr:MAG: lipid A biosynthesis lauroyl acyltransferase [Lentisphaerae bacterium ADurb.BinA184]
MCAQYARLAAGVPLCAVARRLRNPGLDRLVNASRTRHGLELIAERGAMRHMLGALRAGKSLGILIDQNVLPEHGGEFVEFFGLPVPTTRAVAMLARRLGVEAACFACRREGTGFAMEMRALPKPVPAYGSDIELTQDLLRLNEDLIRTCPEQYMWFYERWRHLPPDVDAATRARFPSYARFHRSRRERAAAAATAATDPQAAAPPDRAAANMPPDSPLP